MKLTTFLTALIAITLIYAAFSFSSSLLALLGGALYGLALLLSFMDGERKLTNLLAAVERTNLTKEFNTLLSRVQREIDNG